MDALSEVLKIVKLRGALFFNAEFSAPWSVATSQSSQVAPLLCPGAGHVIIYHYLADGRAYAQLPDGSRRDLRPGDVVIFPHGDAHILGSGAGKTVHFLNAFAKNLRSGLKVARYGGGGELTKFVCGYMACDPSLSEVVLAGLPSMFVVNIASDSAGQWLANSIQFSVREAEGLGIGSDVVLARLSEVLFVEILRRFIQELPDQQKGWLAGARDPVIGETLALLHKNPAHPWTIANLAHQVGISRTRFAERFRHFLGQPPMAYLTHWRLKLAAEMLVSSNANVGEIAAEVGYASEAAFNRVFKREFGCPPAQFRRSRDLTYKQTSA
jgi:AraC-like DNA-binding protein